ncbi:hypothetical protein [Flavobacterium sp. NKUCC04_CG]|uniref:hypothetical protein n=1 Tax=Flavobacterium sp. NKUCC04_CG TaxID=2842121 RepID=UPI001C5B6430|nr:hypothetical protein [Flavobacterium sp. NKUCC04_CG]MBW3518824.1 hypothetical protein [Flavobacterium sp. NKUCC04_CG]
MRKIFNYFGVCLLVVCLLSCSSDDDTSKQKDLLTGKWVCFESFQSDKGDVDSFYYELPVVIYEERENSYIAFNKKGEGFDVVVEKGYLKSINDFQYKVVDGLMNAYNREDSDLPLIQRYEIITLNQSVLKLKTAINSKSYTVRKYYRVVEWNSNTTYQDILNDFGVTLPD